MGNARFHVVQQLGTGGIVVNRATLTQTAGGIIPAQALTLNGVWPSVDLKYPSQLDAAGKQLQAVWDGFSAALALAAQRSPADVTTADLLTEVSRGVDQQLWFVESHLAPKQVKLSGDH